MVDVDQVEQSGVTVIGVSGHQSEQTNVLDWESDIWVGLQIGIVVHDVTFDITEDNQNSITVGGTDFLAHHKGGND